jgi:hypothetical protein
MEECRKLEEEWVGVGLCQQTTNFFKRVVSGFCSDAGLMTELDMVRGHYGEEIAFFFMYFACFIKSLLVLTIAALIPIFANTGYMPSVGHDYVLQNKFKRYFGYFTFVWAVCFQTHATRCAARCGQRWGMKYYESVFETVRKEYDAKKDRLLVFCGTVCSYVAMVLYMLFFNSSLVAVLKLVPDEYEATMTSVTIKVFSFAWGKLANTLVGLQNIRTPSHHRKTLAFFLSVVKLVVYIYPFLSIAFLQNFNAPSKHYCGDDIEEVADKVFASGRHPWPIGVEKENVKSWFEEYTYETDEPAFHFRSSQGESHTDLLVSLKHFTSDMMDGDDKPYAKVCAYGCVPKKCDLDDKDNPDESSASCLTDCYFKLQSNLWSLFAIHFASTVAFIIIPFVLVKRAIVAEQTKNSKTYTYLQVQAKKVDEAPYDYLQWGGSYVEDYLEVILSLAMIVCFGILSPQLAAIALFFQALEYSLLAYRMVHITARPDPAGSPGIDEWRGTMSIILTVATWCSSLFCTYMMRGPMRRRTPTEKLVGFFIYFVGFTLVRQGIEVFAGFPGDVVRIFENNAEFKQFRIREKSKITLNADGEATGEALKQLDVGRNVENC